MILLLIRHFSSEMRSARWPGRERTACTLWATSRRVRNGWSHSFLVSFRQPLVVSFPQGLATARRIRASRYLGWWPLSLIVLTAEHEFSMTECSSKHNRGVEQVFVRLLLYFASLSLNKLCRRSSRLHAAPFPPERRGREVILVPTSAYSCNTFIFHGHISCFTLGFGSRMFLLSCISLSFASQCILYSLRNMSVP